MTTLPYSSTHEEATEVDDTISLIDDNVADLAREARRELGIRPAGVIPEDVSSPGETSQRVSRPAAPKNTRKRTSVRPGEKEVKTFCFIAVMIMREKRI